MNKQIKVPYEYTSGFFGTSKRYRWLPILVAENVDKKTFVPDYVPHSVSKDTYYKVERDCAKIWLEQFWSSPKNLDHKEIMGILTLLDTGVPDFVKHYGGNPRAILDSLNAHLELTDEESTAALIEALMSILS